MVSKGQLAVNRRALDRYHVAKKVERLWCRRGVMDLSLGVEPVAIAPGCS